MAVSLGRLIGFDGRWRARSAHPMWSMHRKADACSHLSSDQTPIGNQSATAQSFCGSLLRLSCLQLHEIGSDRHPSFYKQKPEESQFPNAGRYESEPSPRPLRGNRSFEARPATSALPPVRRYRRAAQGDAMGQDQPHAPQHSRSKKKDRLVRRTLRNPIGCVDQTAASAAAFFRFLRQPSRPNAPRPVANKGTDAGRGVAPGADTLPASATFSLPQPATNSQ